MSRTSRGCTSEQKAQIVRRYLVGKEPVSALVEESMRQSQNRMSAQSTHYRHLMPCRASANDNQECDCQHDDEDDLFFYPYGDNQLTPESH